METMDSASVLRKLVLKHDVSGLLNLSDAFSFETVFYRTGYSYCVCPCGFEHEYFDYISDDGSVDLELFENIWKSVVVGKCPHVDEVDDEYVTETTVHGIHILAALGLKESFANFGTHTLLSEEIVCDGIFQLHPYVIAVLKNGEYQVLNQLVKMSYTPLKNWSSSILNGIRSGASKELLTLKRLPLFEFCIEKRHVELTKSILNDLLTPTDQSAVASAYEMMSKQGHIFAQPLALLFDKVNCVPDSDRETFDMFNSKEYISCAEPAIVCNEPETLDNALKCLEYEDLQPYFISALVETSDVLNSDVCTNVLKKNNIAINTENITEDAKTMRLLHLLQYYPQSRDEIVTALKQISKVTNAKEVSDIEDNMPNLELPILSYIYHGADLDVGLVRTLFEIGANIDKIDEIDDFQGTLLQQLLVNGRDNKQVRQFLELLLYENPCPEMNDDAVDLALKLDNEMYYSWSACLRSMPGEYIMDVKEHGAFGHDGPNGFVFNYSAPLLIECGYPFRRATLEKRLKTEQTTRRRGKGGRGLYDTRPLHPDEKLYFEKCLDEPRSLLLLCRDVLRRTFKRHKIHEYVASSNIPDLLQEFILLKSILRTPV